MASSFWSVQGCVSEICCCCKPIAYRASDFPLYHSWFDHQEPYEPGQYAVPMECKKAVIVFSALPTSPRESNGMEKDRLFIYEPKTGRPKKRLLPCQAGLHKMVQDFRKSMTSATAAGIFSESNPICFARTQLPICCPKAQASR